MKNFFLFALISILLFSCKNSNHVEEVERSFYFWNCNYQQSDKTESKLKNLEVAKIYYKIFEVDYSEVRGNFPYEKCRPNSYNSAFINSLNVVPTIFVKNEIFQYNDEKSLDKLADNIVFLTQKYSTKETYDNKVEILFDYDEIQIDCDWTKSTKDKYFYLLKKIKELSNKKVSCTLRLYPYKYPDIMGVPPVDKATLMCYNLIKPLSQQDKNSILDIDELKKYLDKKRSYPIHLDIALPIFYWTQLYQNNRFMSLLDLCSKDVVTFAKKVKPMWYQVERDTTINSTYLLAGDMLKTEDISGSTIHEAINIIKKQVELDKKITVSFFDLDSNTFNQYSDEEISSYYSDFTK